MQIWRIDTANAAGLVDKVVGLGKELVGSVVGNSSLKKAGQAQQEKGTERLKALEEQARAQKLGAQAAADEQAQRSAQKTKETAGSSL